MALLEVAGLSVRYGKALAVESVSITVDKGELVGVLGPNGAGKTTLLKAISRAIPATGILKFKGETLDRLPPYDVVARGICHCPEGRRLFPELSVLKNLQLGAYLRSNKAENSARYGPRVHAVSGSWRAPAAAVEYAVGRRAADAGDRAGDDGTS